MDDSKKPKKEPYVITLKSGDIMTLAGLWDAWKEPKQSPQTVDMWLQSFSIVTTEANEIMSTIHTRMSVILHERDWARWLSREDIPLPLDLLRPFDSEAMRIDRANPLVGNVRNNGPEMLNSA